VGHAEVGANDLVGALVITVDRKTRPQSFAMALARRPCCRLQ
jgi:hypothetical protein